MHATAEHCHTVDRAQQLPPAQRRHEQRGMCASLELPSHSGWGRTRCARMCARRRHWLSMPGKMWCVGALQRRTTWGGTTLILLVTVARENGRARRRSQARRCYVSVYCFPGTVRNPSTMSLLSFSSSFSDLFLQAVCQHMAPLWLPCCRHITATYRPTSLRQQPRRQAALKPCSHTPPNAPPTPHQPVPSPRHTDELHCHQCTAIPHRSP